MITSLSLKNFKSWQQIDGMRLAPITGLFGTNSSGKSSILQWLLMLKQTVESSDRAQAVNLGGSGSRAALGSFSDVVHAHQSPGAFGGGLSWTLGGMLEVVDPEQGPDAIVLRDDKITWRTLVEADGSGGMRIERMIYDFAEMTFGYAFVPPGPWYSLWTKEPETFRLKRRVGRPWDLPAPVKCYGFPDQVSTYYQNAGFLSSLALEFEVLFARVYHLGPLRKQPERHYSWTGAAPSDVGVRGELSVHAMLAARLNGAKIPRGKGRPAFSLQEYVAYWLQEMGLISEFRVEPLAGDSGLYRVRVRAAADAPEVFLTDVGFGVSQLLPVIVLCYYVPEGSTVLLEQPEIHLHPSAQSTLADVLIDAARVRKIQIIVESHSEHLLRRLQRRIAEKSLARDEVALYFCEVKQGASTLTPLDLDTFGNVRNWPKEFFGDAIGEMVSMGNAIAGRRQQGER